MCKYLLGIILLASCYAAPQQGTAPAPAGNPALHQKILQLVDLMGAREQMANNLPKLAEQGMAQMREKSPTVDPAFAAEWGKRMQARIKLDDFVAVMVNVYEKHFTADDVDELTRLLTAQKNSTPYTMNPQFQARLAEMLPAIQGEIVGATTELGARLGSTIGHEIEQEHPEYFRNSKPPGQ